MENEHDILVSGDNLEAMNSTTKFYLTVVFLASFSFKCTVRHSKSIYGTIQYMTYVQYMYKYMT